MKCGRFTAPMVIFLKGALMTITFLAHSSFLLELPALAMLFDFQGGVLPGLPPKPLLVFASHRHEDHFTPDIFRLDDGAREVRLLLGKDLKLTEKRMERWGLTPETAAKCLVLEGNEKVCPMDGVTVETLPSTDEGVAFLITAAGRTIFHAGDLNWWHWEGEDKAWNNSMAASFRRYCEPLRGREIDLAMLPLDPRQGVDGYRGAKYYLETACIRRFLPMHQWGRFAFTDDFLAAYPGFAAVTEKITHDGQTFTF